MFNNEQVLSLVRWVFSTLGTYLVTNGLLTADDVATAISSFSVIVGAVMPLVAIGWSMFHHQTPAPTPALVNQTPPPTFTSIKK